MFEGDEHQITFCEVLPHLKDLTKEEISFVRKVYDEIKIDFESDNNITIQTDPLDFSQFIIYIVRRYHDLINRPKIS